MESLLLVTTGLSVFLILLVLTSVRRSHIRVEYSVAWLFAAIVLLLVSLSPGLLEAVSDYLGLPGPPVVLLILVGFVFLLTFFRFSVVISKLRDDNIALAQRVAILEYHIRSAQERLGQTQLPERS